jgi:hypothetical protein
MVRQDLMQRLPDATPQLSPEGGIGIQSVSIGELAKAKAAADLELRNVGKSSANPFFSSTYADLDAITKSVRPVYAKHELSFSQAPWFIDGIDVLLTTLMHSSGQWMRSVKKIDPVPDKSGNITPQAVGSALTYARRYALSGMANLAQTDDDDDGNAASNPDAPAPASPADEPAHSEDDLEFILAGISNITGSASFVAWKNATEEQRNRVPEQYWRPAAMDRKKELNLP